VDKIKLLTALDNVKEISSPSPVLSEVLEFVNKPDVSNAELADIILKDPALTTKLLKSANSTFYGVKREVTSINQAIMIMGLKSVKYYTLSIVVFNQVNANKNNSKLNQKQLWRHFLETAIASRKIAELIRYDQPEEAYVAGLLHDIGIVIIENTFPKEYQEVVRLILQNMSICDAEKKVFGIDHQEVADYVTTRWNMPEKLRAPLKLHHLYNDDNLDNLSDLVKIVSLADCISQVSFSELSNLYNTEKRIVALNNISNSIGINPKSLIEIHLKLAGEVSDSAKAMDMETGDAIEILSESNAQLFNSYLELSTLFKERRELSRKMLIEERTEGTIESLKIALATLSHYINNATMNIQGKCEIMGMLLDRDENEKIIGKLPTSISSMETSVKKISLILEELSNISSMENLQYFRDSKAIDIEKKIKEKLSTQFEKVI